MPTRIELEIVPEMIDPEEWATVYDKTLRLLQAHPSQLMGLDQRTFEGIDVGLYTSDLERDRDDPIQRRWCVSGDRESFRFGEDHVLYRDLEHYRGAPRGEPHPDILLVTHDLTLDWPGTTLPASVESIPVLSKNTLEYPYHLPILAAALVVETHFPQKALVSGDITVGMAQRAQQWAESVLQESVSLPVRVVPTRLRKRLAEHLSGKDLTMALDLLLLDIDPVRQQESTLSVLEEHEREEWFLTTLMEQETPSALERTRLFISWLNVTSDLKRLCTLLCSDDRGPHYSGEKLVESLAHIWTTIPRNKTQELEYFSLPKDKPPSTVDLDSCLALDVGGAIGRHLTVRFEEGHVETVLTHLFGDECPRLISLLREKTSFDPLMTALRPIVEGLVNQCDERSSESLENLILLKSTDLLSEQQRMALHGLALAVNRVRDRLEATESEAFSEVFGDLRNVRRKLVQSLADHKPKLTEAVWDWIREEENQDTLRFLTLLCVMPGRQHDFAQLRRAVLENRPLLDYAMKAGQDETLMAEVRQFIEAHLPGYAAGK